MAAAACPTPGKITLSASLTTRGSALQTTLYPNLSIATFTENKFPAPYSIITILLISIKKYHNPILFKLPPLTPPYTGGETNARKRFNVTPPHILPLSKGELEGVQSKITKSKINPFFPSSTESFLRPLAGQPSSNYGQTL